MLMSVSDEPIRLSIAIPNFNYGRYLGAAIASVMEDPSTVAVEVHVADNASTDDSRAVVEAFNDPRVRLSANRANVGFARNLDRAVVPCAGRHVMMLCADDVVLPGAIDLYGRMLGLLGARAERTVVGASAVVIDGQGNPVEDLGPPLGLWGDADVDSALSEELGARVLRVPARTMLRRALLTMRNPLPLTSIMFPRRLFDLVEGYGSSRLINPDKLFNWRVLAEADDAVWIDTPVSGYRVHGENQKARQQRSRALKHLVDEYLCTFDLPPAVLSAADVEPGDLSRAFLRVDVAQRSLIEVAQGNRAEARRMCRFGLAVYPREARRQWAWWCARLVAFLGPLGTAGVRAALKRRAAHDSSAHAWVSSPVRQNLTTASAPLPVLVSPKPEQSQQ
jgi:glycosyltransferase involved in cell wall biosynthesis